MTRRSCEHRRPTSLNSSASAERPRPIVSPRPFPWRFSYVKERDPENNPLVATILRPLVEARLIGPNGREGTKVAALVDSGSSYTLCFHWMAQEVGSAATAVNPVPAGVGLTWPLSLLPQDTIEPSERSARLWISPAPRR